ncbi:MAG TPA: hypothetical protein VGR01_01550, partial [Burkholderiales bacterium]|nr:hypothetical protein [Burkholderiales bacterium]
MSEAAASGSPKLGALAQRVNRELQIVEELLARRKKPISFHFNLVLRPANNFTKPFEFGEDRIGGGGPGEGPGVRVPVFDKALDVAAQIG